MLALFSYDNDGNALTQSNYGVTDGRLALPQIIGTNDCFEAEKLT